MCGAIWKAETKVLNDDARRAADGSFVMLAHGYTHYQDASVPPARPVVLVHGFSVPYFIWDPTFCILAEAGLKPLRYDLYGRGYSDRPRVPYDMALFVEQLCQLLDALGHVEVDLIGLSMGGAIASAFTVTFPDRVRKLVLIDPSGARPIDLGFLYKLAVLPGVSDLVIGIAGTECLLDSAGKGFFDPALIEAFRERYRIQMEFRGFKRAILSTVRHKMLGSFSTTYAQLGRLGTQVLLVWGENDRTVPFEHSRVLRQLLPEADLLVVPDCGHIPHYERPQIVNPRLIDFLN